MADHYVGIMPPGWVQRQLASGLALVLVDGVDELTGPQRQKVRGWLRKLVHAYPKARYVVTSRPAAAAANWLAAEGFGSAMLGPMSPADITAFVRQWHAAIRAAGNLPCSEAELPRYEKALLGRLAAAPHLRALATAPLLCAMLCALNLDRNTYLPRDRMGLYRAALDLLLERRDAERDVPSSREVPLTAEQKTTLLQDLAWRLAESDLSEAPTERVTDWIGLRAAQMPGVDAEPAKLLDHLLHRSGVTREPVAGRVDFVHRTFQEYLAAKEAAETDRLLVVAGRAHRDQWREVVVMAAGHANPRLCAELVEALLDRADREPRHARRLKLLAAACLETARLLPPDLLRRVEGCLDELLPPRSIVEARTLAAVGEQALRHLPRDLSGLSEAAAAATVRTAVLVNGPAALALLAGYAADSRKRVQRELVAGWDYFDPDEYARVVLADAPLDEGGLRLSWERQGLLPHTRRLRRLRRLEAFAGDLALLAGVPALTELTVPFDEAADLSVLTQHQAVERLNLWYLGDEPLDLAALRGLPHLVELAVGCRWLESLDVFTQFPGLRSLTLFGLDRIMDFIPLTRLDGLQELGLREAPRLRDLAFLAQLPRLSELSLSEVPLDGGLAQVPAVTPQLRQFAMFHTDWVRDLTPLAELKRLEWLNLGGCRQVTDLTPLAGHPRLERLFLWETAVRDLTPLAGLRTLRYLNLHGVSEEVDLSPLAGLSGLEVRLAKGQRVRGLDAVRGRVRIRRI